MDQEPVRRMHGVRARALATMILTRRDDLLAIAPDRPTADGPDLLVQFHRPGQPIRPALDVLVYPVATTTPPPPDDPLWATISTRFQRAGRWHRPTGVIFASLRDDRAYFTWVIGPMVVDGAPLLTGHVTWKLNCIELTRPVLDRIVAEVDAWAAASAPPLTSEPPQATPHPHELALPI